MCSISVNAVKETENFPQSVVATNMHRPYFAGNEYCKRISTCQLVLIPQKELVFLCEDSSFLRPLTITISKLRPRQRQAIVRVVSRISELHIRMLHRLPILLLDSFIDTCSRLIETQAMDCRPGYCKFTHLHQRD